MERAKEETQDEKFTQTVDEFGTDPGLEEEDNSPVEKVRVTVPNKDDPSMPCNTFRMWSLGLLFTAAVSFVNQFFYLRQTQISIGYSVVALISLPIGHWMAKVLPTHQMSLFKLKFCLSPGPFSLKEHILIGTMVAANTSTAYAVDIVILQHVFYDDQQPFIAGLLLVWTKQITGFTLAGVICRFLVRPAHMVWPSTLVTASLFRSLHASAEENEEEEGGRMSRMRYFMMVTTGSFIYYWLPGLIFPTLGPSRIMFNLWSRLGSQVNILIGFIMVAYIMVPWAYYTDLWNSKNYPILSPALFREDGTLYNKTEILTDMEMVERWKSARAENEDIHSRLMRVYPEVPDWWYAVLFVITLALSLVTCTVWNFIPWWAVLLALAIAIFFVLPVGIVQAVTNQQPGLNIVTEYVIGYLLPGHAIANVTLKSYGYIVNVQALTFTSDLKLGHYMKIPPQVMFMAQLVSTIISGLINLATTRDTLDPTFDGALYAPVQWGFLVGALLPIPFWFAAKKFPHMTWLKYVHWSVLLAATSSMPPALPYFYSNGLFVGFIFAFLLRRYRYHWWARYNYLTSAALDSGVAVCGLIIFSAIQSWEGEMPYWWGQPRGR
ncbi:MAG: OPT family small oligopeptide transporter [Benniella sp.]|nr:MAG: OPT family small oligopeptide transporter [Benniella sp.]